MDLPLEDGLYEKVLSKDLAKWIEEAEERKEVWADRAEGDAQESAYLLSSYVAHLLTGYLKDIADTDDKNDVIVKSEVELVNRLIDHLRKEKEDLGKGQEVVAEKFLLQSLEKRRNKVKPTKWETPTTSLTRSFLFTNSKKDTSIVSELMKEISSSDSMDMLVSFIKYSGLRLIYPCLEKFTSRGGKLRIITTTYMGATDPKACEMLSKLKNTEIKISYNVKETRLHAKAYIFHRNSGFSTAYVGSSNLSHAAIADGLEWNMKVTQQDLPHILDKMKTTFEIYWNSDEFVPFQESDAEKLKEAIDRERGKGKEKEPSFFVDVTPYPYQQGILDALQTEREEKGRYKNLVVAATGTGKTLISAFDYRRFAKARKEGAKLLFIAHREEILKQSIAAFRQVLKNDTFGELAVGNHSFNRTEHLFMSIQTFNSKKFWEYMDPDFYDMIIVDEFHHAAAKSYQKLLSHFQPKILLGLTATPERMDGENILSYFDNHVAAEIRLSDAIEKRLLCPFHYFGVTDTVNLESVSWRNGQYDTKELENLFTVNTYVAKERANAILQALDKYTADMRDVKGLGFCVSQKHAHFMADYFRNCEIPAIALDANSSNEERKNAKKRLESGEIAFIFTVDLFNEGVDIPAVNTVLFLRPTNSLTVFIQQLGRGLRLSEGKDALTVLDFVAQANKNFDYARRYQALLGKKIEMKKEIKNYFPHVPKGCSVQLEEIAQQRVLDNINRRIGRMGYYKQLVQELYYAAGETVPSLEEFLKASGTDPLSFYNGHRTYQKLLAEADLIPVFHEEESNYLAKAAPKILAMDAGGWIRFLQKALQEKPKELTKVEEKYLRMWNLTFYDNDFEDMDWENVSVCLDRLSQNPHVKKEIEALLAIQYDHIDVVSPKLSLPYDCPLEIYRTYTRKQILAALGLAKPGSVREGVKYLHEKNSDMVTKDTDVFFVTLNKSEKEFSDTTLYDDYAVDKKLFHWQSQNTTSPESSTGKRYISQIETGSIVLLFVRSNKNMIYGNQAMPFTFLGPATIVQWSGSRPMSILYRLEHPIPAKYIAETDSSGVL